MNCRMTSSLIGFGASPATLWTDNRYCDMVMLLKWWVIIGGRFPPVTLTTNGPRPDRQFYTRNDNRPNFTAGEVCLEVRSELAVSLEGCGNEGHFEWLAPDDDRVICVEVQAGWDRVVLRAL